MGRKFWDFVRFGFFEDDNRFWRDLDTEKRLCDIIQQLYEKAKDNQGFGWIHIESVDYLANVEIASGIYVSAVKFRRFGENEGSKVRACFDVVLNNALQLSDWVLLKISPERWVVHGPGRPRKARNVAMEREC